MPMLSRALYKIILKNTPRALRIRSNQHLSPQYVLNCQGRTAIVKLESSKPLVIDPDGTLVNIHDQNHGAVPRQPQEAGQVNTITLLSATQTYKEVKKQQDIFHNSVAAGIGCREVILDRNNKNISYV